MNEASLEKQRQDLESMFRAGLAAVHGTCCVADYLEKNPLHNRTRVVAIGKAASAMATGAGEALGEQFLDSLLITRDGHIDPLQQQDSRFTCLEAGHPVPDERSLAAGDSLCRFLGAAPVDAEILFLVSGGASSLVEVLPDSTGLEQLQQLNQWLIASGLDISVINRVRSSVSRIKGGGLVEYLQGRKTTALLISDVAGDDPAMIGSGLLYPVTKHGLPVPGLPDWILDITRAAERTPGSGECTYGSIEHQVVANIDTALKAAALAGNKLGYSTQIMGERLEGNSADVGARLVTQLRDRQPGVTLWGGETTVTLPPVTGKGGRNQHLALAAACAMDDDENIVLLSAGTDGSDGSSSAAGAIVDAGTIARGLAGGLDPGNSLRQADSGRFLEACGDVLVTGHTGTNVTDMVIGLKPDNDS